MKNVLIADAGSTKTDWVFITNENNSPIRFYTTGINPVQDSPQTISSVVREAFSKVEKEKVEKIFFFGAGCATSQLKDKIREILSEYWNKTQIDVESDLVGAGLALFGDFSGLICILGTGSSTGLFSNGKILRQIPSLGYILGDEGSGVSLGKTLLNSIFKEQLPIDIVNKFKDEYKLTLEELLKAVYISPKPARFIASFTPFLYNNLEIEEIRKIVEFEFEKFFKKNILPYGDVSSCEVGMVGSVAYNFSEIIRESSKRFDINISSIVKAPIPCLEKYYIRK